jgi:uncharacterized protein (TIGR03083 family)
MTFPGDAPTVPDLIDAWQSAASGVIALGESLTEAQWQAQTPCPGWSVADVVAHCIDVEEVVGGCPRPDHQVDLTALPHARGPIGELTEIGVDYRRGRPSTDLLAEFRSVVEERRRQLDRTPQDAEVMGPFLASMPIERLLRMRTFDLWVHTQDIRAAVGRDGDWDTPGAVIAFQQMTRAIPFAWARNAKAPTGATVRVQVTGPDLTADVSAIVDGDGRGRPTVPVESPAVTLVVSWPDFMRLACGRIDPGDPGLRDRIELTGDAALGAALLPALSIAP